MVGSKLIVISGIDGNFDDFDLFLGNKLNGYIPLGYEKKYSFSKNFNNMKTKLDKVNGNIIMGWSIGAAMALALSKFSEIQNCIMINSFFNRKKVLSQRGIEIPDHDNVFISDFTTKNKNITIIAGYEDERIPYTESLCIFECLKNENNLDVFILSGASHKLLSFPIWIRKLLFQKITNNGVIK